MVCALMKKMEDGIFLSEDVAKLILRLSLGIMMLLHGVFKIMHPEAVGYIGSLFSGIGLPAFFAYLIYVGEVLAPVLIIIGYRTRLAGLVAAITMVVAILLAHSSQIFSLTEMGGWMIELQAFYLFSALTVFGLGAGKYSIDAKMGGETMGASY